MSQPSADDKLYDLIEQISPRLKKPMIKTQHDLGISSNLAAMDQFLNVDGKFIIDAGCGDMSLSRELSKRGARVLAIDPDPIQAAKNQKADTIANVGFAQSGADAIPVESHSVDGVIFSYSLHHVPKELYPAVFKELFRVLNPNGFIYVIEPVASGHLNEVMSLFHDEKAVRQAAQEAIDKLAAPRFKNTSVIEYRIPVQYTSWEEYAEKYASKSYNTNYTERQVRDEKVEKRFLDLGKPIGFKFESPMRVTYLHCVLH